VADFDFLRVLWLGIAKSGKTYTILTTCPLPVYVINSDQASSLVGPRRALRKKLGPQADKQVTWDLVHTMSEMELALREARRGVNTGEYKTVVWDTMSNFAAMLEDACMEESRTPRGEIDPRRAWPEYAKRLVSICNRLLKLKAHVIVTSHYTEKGGSDDGPSVERTGGVVPMLGGKAKSAVPALFQDVVFFEKTKDDRRVINTAIRGVFGPGCRSLEGHKIIKGDVKALIRSFGTGDVSAEDEATEDRAVESRPSSSEDAAPPKKKKKAVKPAEET
jgi:hypothetical protein